MSSDEDPQRPRFIDRKELAPFRAGIVLSEVNLLKHPFTLLSENNIKQLLTEAAQHQESHIRCRIQLPDGSTRTWQVNPNIKTGYTRPFDKKVLVTVLKLVSEDEFPPPVIWKLGSVRRICRAMGLNDSGPNLKAVRESIERIGATNIYTETFWLKEEGEYWSEDGGRVGGSFSPWSVIWQGQRLPNDRESDSIYLTFNIPFLLSLQAYYVKPLDYGYWLSLPPLAQRLYELSGLKFYGLQHSNYVKYEYGELCELLPAKRQNQFSNAKQVLSRAHKKLQETGWLEQVQWVKNGQSTYSADNPWEILYYPGPRAKEEVAQAHERLDRFKKKQASDQLAFEWQDVQAWVMQLSELLNDKHGQNHGFYAKLGKLIVQGKLRDDMVWEAAHLAKTEDLAGNISTNRSAFFTDYLKRELSQYEIELKDLLKEA